MAAILPQWPGVWWITTRPRAASYSVGRYGRETPFEENRDDDESAGRRAPALVAGRRRLRAGSAGGPRGRGGGRRGRAAGHAPQDPRAGEPLRHLLLLPLVGRPGVRPRGRGQREVPDRRLLPPARRVGRLRLLAVLEQRLFRRPPRAGAARHRLPARDRRERRPVPFRPRDPGTGRAAH